MCKQDEPPYDDVPEHFKSADITHGKMGHLCSTLCGASMIRAAEEQRESRFQEMKEEWEKIDA
jgi:hypothetical protein